MKIKLSPPETGTIRLESSEITNRKDFSGAKTTLLWGFDYFHRLLKTFLFSSSNQKN